MLRFGRNIIATGLLSFISLQAQATIISGDITGGGALSSGGTFVNLPVPFVAPVTGDASVGNDTFQNPNLYAFNEDQNIIIPSDLTVDVGSSPIAANTVVASHYVFFDPVNNNVAGYVEFDAPILGILTSTATMAATDYLANTGVNYLSPTLRGLEAGDSAVIDLINPNRVDVNFTASTPGDYIRVLTAQSPAGGPPIRPLPEPTTIALLSLGLVGLGIRRRNRVSKR